MITERKGGEWRRRRRGKGVRRTSEKEKTGSRPIRRKRRRQEGREEVNEEEDKKDEN